MILFLHVPGFYAAVEQTDTPALRGRPIIVGGDPHKRGTVTSASAEARAQGVVPGMAVGEALERCPGAALRPTRMRRYRDVAREVRAILRAASDRLEEDGLDGTYLEIPPREAPLPMAAELCVRVQAEVGVHAVAGIGPTRFVAFLAGQDPGPAGIRSIAAGEARAFLAGFPTSSLWGLGPTTADKLAERGVATIGDVQAMSLEELQEIVGRNAASFRSLALAEDSDPLRTSPRAKSLSQEETLAEPTVDLGLLGDRIFELAGRLEAVLARERRAARTVSLTVRYVDETQVTRTQTARDPSSSQSEIRDVALDLLSRTHAGVRLVRRIRLQVTNLTGQPTREDPRQLRLF